MLMQEKSKLQSVIQRSQRIKFEARVAVTFKDGVGFVGKTLDVSQSGAMIMSGYSHHKRPS